MARHRSHSVQFKRQVAQEYIAGETLHGLAKRYDISRNLIRVWVKKYQEGAYDEEGRMTWLIHEYEARIADLERLVGRQALELELLRNATPPPPRAKTGGETTPDGPTAIGKSDLSKL